MTENFFVGDDQYRAIDRRMNEVKRRLNRRHRSPLDPDVVLRALQQLIDGTFSLQNRFHASTSLDTMIGQGYESLFSGIRRDTWFYELHDFAYIDESSLRSILGWNGESCEELRMVLEVADVELGSGLDSAKDPYLYLNQYKYHRVPTSRFLTLSLSHLMPQLNVGYADIERLRKADCFTVGHMLLDGPHYLATKIKSSFSREEDYMPEGYPEALVAKLKSWLETSVVHGTSGLPPLGWQMPSHPRVSAL